VQNRSKKLTLQAGQDAIRASARLRFDARLEIYRTIGQSIHATKPLVERVITCALSQQMFPSFHLAPHRSTSCCLTSAVGGSAGPLYETGSCPPKKDFFSCR